MNKMVISMIKLLGFNFIVIIYCLAKTNINNFWILLNRLSIRLKIHSLTMKPRGRTLRQVVGHGHTYMHEENGCALSNSIS
jgi:hypothetical protein